MRGDDGEHWHLAAKVGEVRDDEALAVTLGEQQIAVVMVGGTYYAIANVCTHEYACLSDGLIEGEEIECPLHQARFHIPTGKALTEPAIVDLRTFKVKIEGQGIYVLIAKE